jgi:hypothetical protein
LKGLQGEAGKDESDPEDSQPSLGKVVSVELDEGIHRRSDAGNKAGHEAYPDRKRPRVINPMHQNSADQCGNNIADGAT